MITNDPITWPTGDKLWDLARAIAKAEGANELGSNPDRLNNPGDISDGAHIYNQEFHSGSHITHFPNKETGWNWLRDKLQNAANGHSHVFLPSMTWTEFAQKYAANWQPWVKIVTHELGVDVESTFADYMKN